MSSRETHGTRDDRPEPYRIVIVRPTRDGDHIVINLNIGKWNHRPVVLKRVGFGHSS